MRVFINQEVFEELIAKKNMDIKSTAKAADINLPSMYKIAQRQQSVPAEKRDKLLKLFPHVEWDDLFEFEKKAKRAEDRKRKGRA